MPHSDISQIARLSAFDFRKSDLPGVLPSDVLRRNLLEVRKARGLTQKQLAERMTASGMPMTGVKVSRIERGDRGVSVDELFVFAAILEKPIVRLVTPLPDEETLVRISAPDRTWDPGKGWRLFRSVELRNWIVYGDASSPAAKGAQTMMRFAYAARDYIVSDGAAKAAAKPQLEAELKEIRNARS